MKQSGRCPKCGSEDVIRDAEPVDATTHGTGPQHVAVYERPQAWLFRGERTSALSACVCTHCGFTELYAQHPDRLIVPEVPKRDEKPPPFCPECGHGIPLEDPRCGNCEWKFSQAEPDSK